MGTLATAGDGGSPWNLVRDGSPTPNQLSAAVALLLASGEWKAMLATANAQIGAKSHEEMLGKLEVLALRVGAIAHIMRRTSTPLSAVYLPIEVRCLMKDAMAMEVIPSSSDRGTAARARVRVSWRRG